MSSRRKNPWWIPPFLGRVPASLDDASLRWLDFVGRRLTGLAVVVLVAAHSAFSVLGIAAVVAIAVAVGVFAFLQGKAL